MLRVAVLTRRGSGREINQDRVVVGGTVVDHNQPTTTMFDLGCPSVVAVLDGLGGHPAGEIAAALAAEVIAHGNSEVGTEQDVTSLVERPTGICTMRCSSTKACGTWAPPSPVRSSTPTG